MFRKNGGAIALTVILVLISSSSATAATTTGSSSRVTQGTLHKNDNKNPSDKPSRTKHLVLGLWGGGGGDGNGSPEDERILFNNETKDEATKSQAEPSAVTPSASTTDQNVQQQQKMERRHASSVISSITDFGLSEESYELRKLMATRARLFLEEQDEDQQHPKKLLHYEASRIPAIKHSPDSSLKITFASMDDVGAAAYCIGTVARVCELYETMGDGNSESSIASAILADRRFEQLVECVLCGVNVQKRKRQEAAFKEQETKGSDKKSKKGSKEVTEKNDMDVQHENDEEDDDDEFGSEDAQIDEGISVRDACRAAWGIALMGGHHLETIGGEKTRDLLLALSLRTRELLLARLYRIQGKTDTTPTRLEMNQESKLLAQDTACAMWAFACVDACTRLKSYPLFHVCCSILCQSPQAHVDLEEGLTDVNYEVDDVVDRLAKSDEDISSGSKSRSEEESPNVMTDALLDWLSPNEVTDVLWALALHGTADETSIKEGRSLSATAGVLREFAFDRLVAWLRHDLAAITARHPQAASKLSTIDQVVATSSSSEPVVHEKQTVDGETAIGGSSTASSGTVEVVDAATLLAMTEDAPTTRVAATTAEHMTMNYGHEDAQVEQVQVVDADALLASSENGETNVETETEVSSKPSTTPDGSSDAVSEETRSVHEGNSVEDAAINDEDEEKPTRTLEAIPVDSVSIQPDSLFFSAHDLCSIAWAVTELRDPLRFLIVDLVVQIFAALGPASTKNLLGFDTSNLVWAICKCSQPAHQPESEDVAPPIMVTQWMAECALIRLGLQDVTDIEDDFWDRISDVFGTFQPPELSRLMWSMATVVHTHGGPFYRENMRSDAMSKLALVVLCTAHSNLSMFATEDLARIAWAFLELCDPRQFSSRTFAAEALGSILATLEASLLRWEGGQCSSASLEEKLKSNESLRYATFFGKPRLSRFIRPLLEQRVGEYDDDEEESETFSVTETTGRPLLRDLTIDPSTLCKAASCFCRLAHDYRDIEASWTLVRVAVRLLTSKNGQLLKECTIHDIIRLCHACATIQVHGEDREFILRIFSRRVVQLLNNSFEEQKKINATITSLLNDASPWELSLLYWSLGELGVRHVATDENARLAHRRLHLVSEKPLLSADQLLRLPFSSLAQLLHGVVSLHAIFNDKEYLRSILSTLLSKVNSVNNGRDAVQVTESVAKIRRSIGPLDPEAPSKLSTGSESVDQAGDKRCNEARDSGEEVNEDSVIDNLVDQDNTTSIDKELLDMCNGLLSAVADKAVHHVSSFTAGDIRQLLLVYSTLPFQADQSVDAIDAEITRRLAALELAASMSDGGSLQDLVRHAADNLVEAGNALSKLESAARDESSPIPKKSGLKSLFASSDKLDETPSQEEGENVSDLLEELSLLANRAAASACEAAARVERVGRGTAVNAEATLRGVEEGASFELGRCKELVAGYRRIDFATGTRHSRYDKERRKDIGKRVLSRLFP